MQPENVIVATFTVKAANEMKMRLAQLVGAEVERRLVLGTFHSIARRYLLRYGHLIGLRTGWGIADTADTKAICQVLLALVMLAARSPETEQTREWAKAYQL